MNEDGKTMLDQTMTGLGIPKGTSIWAMPRKPMSVPKTGATQGKSQQKSPASKGQKPSKGGKMRSGTKARKHIFAGWD